MELVLGPDAPSSGTAQPYQTEILALIAAEDIYSLVAHPYFVEAVSMQFKPVVQFVDERRLLEQVLDALYYKELPNTCRLEVLETHLIAAFNDCSNGSIALAGLVLGQQSTLEKIFDTLLSVTSITSGVSAEHTKAVTSKLTGAPERRAILKIITSILRSFTLSYKNLLAFIDCLLARPTWFECIVSLTGYSFVQELLEAIFIVRFNRVEDVLSKIAVAWSSGGLWDIILKCLLFGVHNCTNYSFTCVNPVKGLASVLIKGLLMDLPYVKDSILEAIPVLTRIIFQPPSDIDIKNTATGSGDALRIRVDSLWPLIDLWVCGVRYLMVSVHQSAASKYLYQDNATHGPGDIIPISDMEQQNVSRIHVLRELLYELSQYDFLKYCTDTCFIPPHLYILTNYLVALARLLCVAGDVKVSTYSKTSGYYPIDYFADPENVHSHNNYQIGNMYGLIPPSAAITISGTEEIELSDIFQTDTGAIIEGSMYGIAAALIKSNAHLFAAKILSCLDNTVAHLHTLCTTIITFLLEYRFAIPQLAEKVLASQYMQDLFTGTLSTLSAHRRDASDNNFKKSIFSVFSNLNLNPIKIIWTCSIVDNLFRMLEAKTDRAYLIGRRLQNNQTLHLSSPTEDDSQRRPHPNDPLKALLGVDTVLYQIKQLSSVATQLSI